jgi:hypothetical protein
MLVLEAIQKNYQPGKIQRITNKEPTEEFFSGQFGEYDCVIKQAVKTATQREAYYYQLLQLVALGAPIPWEDLIEAAPMQGKTTLLEKMAERAEQQQQQQQKIDEAEQIEKALQMSQVDQNTALAEERRARVLADIGLAKERASEASQNYAKAFLDNAKTATEIDNLNRKPMLDFIKMATEARTAEADRAEQKIKRDAQLVKSQSIGVENG